MKNPDSQLQQIRERLTGHVVVLDAKLEMYEDLRAGINDERRKVLNQFVAFFRYAEDAFLTDIILTLTKIYDVSADAKRSLFHYLKLVRDNFGQLESKNSEFTVSTVNLQLAEIEARRVQLETLKIHRDKWRAHHDKQYFDRPAKLDEEAPLNVDDLRQLVEVAKQILWTHHGAFDDIEMVMRLGNADDLTRLMQLLQRHDMLTQKPEVLRILSDEMIGSQG